MSERVAVVARARTPFVKAGSKFLKCSALDLSVHAVDGLLERSGLDPDLVDELAWGIVVVDPRIPQMGREVAFGSNLPARTVGLTVTDNCISGTTAITWIADAIRLGRSEVGIAGGVESMSNPAIGFNRKASRAFVQANFARSMGDRLKALSKLRPTDFLPDPPGVEEPSTGLSMGQHCELMVKEWKIGREEQDEIAYRSHKNAYVATKDGRLKEDIVPLEGVEQDLIVRSDTSVEKLAKLKPVFDRSGAGTITAGNSSPLTDGAASVLLMSESRAEREGVEPLAFVRASIRVAIDPEDGLLMGPGIAVPRLLKQEGLTMEDMDIVEVHEAFGGQVACNLKAWRDGWKEGAVGNPDPDKLNPLGGSIAIGHPFAATGARIVGTMAAEMARKDLRYGLISICAAGAQAGAMILERS